ncbi:methyltransferase [Pseudomonas duriflava]|nr:methyltransferase [Pseudomonas duriflava]
MSPLHSASFLQTHDLYDRFQALDAFLIEHQPLWRPKPFTMLTLLWEADYPLLSAWLRSRTLEEADRVHTQLHLLNAPPPFNQWLRQAMALSVIGELPSQYTQTPSATPADVPGRKWQQVEAFARHAQFLHTPTHWLDWCSGKGHLGRHLAANGAALDCLEFDVALVEEGQRLSNRSQLNANHYVQDVLSDTVTMRLNASHTPVALHACGDLHIRLLEIATRAGCKAMAIAPCCYNRITSDQHQPLSRPALSSPLRLNRDDLSLPLCETVTANLRTRQQRDVSMARRLGFDLLQRDLSGLDEYLPTPSLPTSWLKKSYRDYCYDLAALKQLPVPAERNWQVLERKGWERLAIVRNLELVRGLFRRPLEVWLLLDRALFLKEQGYEVKLGQFCNYSLTPRNLMLVAERS